MENQPRAAQAIPASAPLLLLQEWALVSIELLGAALRVRIEVSAALCTLALTWGRPTGRKQT